MKQKKVIVRTFLCLPDDKLLQSWLNWGCFTDKGELHTSLSHCLGHQSHTSRTPEAALHDQHTVLP